jgi:alpha-L-fucosidase
MPSGAREIRKPTTSRILAGRGQAVRVNREKLRWWREARFGMFIHWGLYALPAGRWKGQDVPGIGEWIMHRKRIPVREYEKLAGRFNPVRFDAEAWVRLAKDAGMRYLVITSKHHDGFAMFRSPSSPYNVVDATPWKHDPMADLARACRKHGIRLCFYYSQDQDWHDPDGSRNDWDFDESGKDFAAYLRRKVRPQLTELLTQYGPIGLIWFDTPYTITRKHSVELKRLVHRIQPDCLVSGRIGHDIGDYGSLGDNQIPVGRIEGEYETPATLNDTWGFKSRDRNWKSVDTLLYLLVDLASKGINYLLNVGPTALGEIPAPSVERLREIGTWMKSNGEAIYGTSASPFPYELPWGRITRKPGRLYLHFFEWPRGELRIHGLRNRVNKAYLLSDRGRRIAVKQTRDSGLDLDVLSLSGFAKRPDPRVSVVVLEISGSARVDPLPIEQPDGTLSLPAFMADRRGPAAGGFTVARGGYTDQWKSPANGLRWKAKVLVPGLYRVKALSSARTEYCVPAGATPHRMRLEIDGPGRATLPFPLVEHGRLESPRAQYFPEIVSEAGEVGFPAPGIYELTLRASSVSKRAPEGIAVTGLELEPAPRRAVRRSR